MTKIKIILATLLTVSLIFMAGCSEKKKTSGENAIQISIPQNLSLKIGVMPAVDAAPIFIAQENGYFKDLDLDVEIEIFNNAQNRQTALQTGTIDGAITDLIAVAVNVNGGFDIKATTMTNGLFPVLVRRDFQDQKNIKVAMMEMSVTNFMMDECLGEQYNIEKVFINEIPARLEMIKVGNVDMGLFPEPMASMGALGGLEKRVYESKDGYCPDVIVFTGKSLREKEEAIKRFHQGYNIAIDHINRDTNEARDILVEKLNLKPEIRDMINLPEYSRAQLPDKAYIDKIIKWSQQVLKKDMGVKPEDLIERKYVQ